MVCLFDSLRPINNLSVKQGRIFWIEPVLSWDKCVLLKDHNAVTPVRLEPETLRSWVKYSTTEPLRSLNWAWSAQIMLVGTASVWRNRPLSTIGFKWQLLLYYWDNFIQHFTGMFQGQPSTKSAKTNLICQKNWSQGGVAYHIKENFENLLRNWWSEFKIIWQK